MPCARSQELDLAEFAVDPRAPAWDDFRHHYLRCAECSREVARFASLAAALTAEGSRAPAHPSEASLVALVRARLTPDEHARIEAHLASCAPCRTELSATSSPIEVTVVDPGTDAPLLETTLPAPLAAGVHRMNLSEHGVRLKAGVDYRWFVALVRDPARRSQDIVSGAAIRFTPPAPDLSTRLSTASAGRAAHVYSESGVWYDAFDQLSRWLETEPGAARLREHRAALLDQAGLGDAAAFEKRIASGER